MSHLTTGMRARVLAAGAAMALSAGSIWAPPSALAAGPRVTPAPRDALLDVVPAMLVFPHFRGLKPTAAFSPSDLGSTKLRLWLRPEGSKFQDSARTTPGSSTQPCGSWTDESGNGNHAGQATSGNRPTIRANGGITLGGSHWLTTSALGAWAADFAVLVVGRVTTYSNYARYASVDYATGWNLMDGATSGEIISGVVAPSAPYGDLITTAAVNTIHSFFDRRVGTSHRLSIDGAADVTSTVTGSAIANGTFYIGSDGGFHLTGHVHEVVVVAGGSAGDLTNLAAYAAARMGSGVYV